MTTLLYKRLFCVSREWRVFECAATTVTGLIDMNDKETIPAEPSQAGEQAKPSLAPITPAAQRALKEAEERRMAAPPQNQAPKEVGGRNGPDPVRYGDWEKKGIASDF